MNALTLNVPLEVPTAEELRAIYREECAKVAVEQAKWLTFGEAALRMRVCKKTFERKRKKFGIPVAEVDGIQLVLADDVDRLLYSNLSVPGGTVIKFPSVEQRDALLKTTAA
jgi:predicted DNA-binding protein (UPF0251 family)